MKRRSFLAGLGAALLAPFTKAAANYSPGCEAMQPVLWARVPSGSGGPFRYMWLGDGTWFDFEADQPMTLANGETLEVKWTDVPGEATLRIARQPVDNSPAEWKAGDMWYDTEGNKQ